MNRTTETYPQCIIEWAKSEHRTVYVTDKLRFEVKLKLDVVFSPTLRKVCEWSTEELVNWLQTLNLRTDYSPKIRNGEYDGRSLIEWVEDNDFEDIITKQADKQTILKKYKKIH